MMFFAKPPVALCFGAFFLCAATCAHSDALATAPLGLASDWIAGIVLIIGGVVSARDWLDGRQYQVVGWAFMTSVLRHSFLGNLSDLLTHAPDAGGSSGLVALPLAHYLVIVGLLLAVSIAGLWTTLAMSKRRGH